MRHALAFVAVFAVATSAFPAETPETPRPDPSAASQPTRFLTLSQALQLGNERNLDVRKALELQNQLRGKRTEAQAAELPRWSATALGSLSRNESDRAQLLRSPDRVRTALIETSASQVLFDWWQTRASVKAAEWGIRAGEDRVRGACQSAALDVATAFYNILMAKRVRTIAEEFVALRRRHLEDARTRRSMGVGTDFDVVSAEVSLANVEPDLLEAEKTVRLARDQLRNLLALEEEVDAEGRLEVTEADYPSYEEAIETAMNNRPELRELNHQIEASRALSMAAQAGDKPRLDLEGKYGWGRVEVGSREAWGPEWSATVVMTWPLFDGLRTRGVVTQRKSEVESLRLEKEKVLHQIRLDVRSARDQLWEALGTMQALSGVAAKADQLVGMTETGFLLGIKTKLDVDDAQENLVRARITLARAYRDSLVALVTLRWVMGTLEEPVEEETGLFFPNHAAPSSAPMVSPSPSTLRH